jgi:hypothetical protein
MKAEEIRKMLQDSINLLQALVVSYPKMEEYLEILNRLKESLRLFNELMEESQKSYFNQKTIGDLVLDLENAGADFLDATISSKYYLILTSNQEVIDSMIKTGEG